MAKIQRGTYVTIIIRLIEGDHAAGTRLTALLLDTARKACMTSSTELMASAPMQVIETAVLIKG